MCCGSRHPLLIWGRAASLAVFLACQLVVPQAAEQAGTLVAAPVSAAAFSDPYGPAVTGFPGCPLPLGPIVDAEQARREAHYRVERGTSCYLSGRCRLPNSYLYDTEIFPRAVRVLQLDGRFADASLWLTVQRRWITVSGCVRSIEQGSAVEVLLRQIDDVEAVVPQWMVGVDGLPPYALKPAGDRPVATPGAAPDMTRP